MFKKIYAFAVTAILSVFSMAAMALPTDYSTLTGAVDFVTVITAMLAVAALTAALYVAWKGIGMILSAIKR